ncbi:MAG: alpha/beta hydrolase [Alistipes sp.]|nr:alpha/beta hydrolase [Candidatus Alistipes equi]
MTENFIMAGKTPLHVSDSMGEGECIVILHGLQEHMVMWEKFSEKLSQNRRVVRVDIPGHGISVINGECHTMDYLAETVHMMAQRLNLQNYYILGYDLGGYIALSMLKHYTKEIKGLVILSALPAAPTNTEISFIENCINAMRDGKRVAMEKSHAELMFANRKKYADDIEDLKEIAQTNEQEGVIALLEGLKKREDYCEDVIKNKAKIRFVFGNEDQTIDKALASKIFESIGTELVISLEEAAHAAYIEKEDEFLQIVLDMTK